MTLTFDSLMVQQMWEHFRLELLRGLQPPGKIRLATQWPLYSVNQPKHTRISQKGF